MLVTGQEWSQELLQNPELTEGPTRGTLQLRMVSIPPGTEMLPQGFPELCTSGQMLGKNSPLSLSLSARSPLWFLRVLLLLELRTDLVPKEFAKGAVPQLGALCLLFLGSFGGGLCRCLRGRLPPMALLRLGALVHNSEGR